MNQSETTLSLLEIKSKRTAVESEIVQLTDKISSCEEELKRYDWLVSNFFSKTDAEKSGKKKTSREIIEAVLLESEKSMSPVEIYMAAKSLGFTGSKPSVYTRLYKWINKEGSNIVRVGSGKYAHKSTVMTATLL